MDIILRECKDNRNWINATTFPKYVTIKCRKELNNGKNLTFDGQLFAIVRTLKMENFEKFAEPINVVGVRVFPGTVGAERDHTLFCFRHLGRGELRDETKQTGELSLHLVRSSSIPKYSPAWRFTFIHGDAFETRKIKPSERTGEARSRFSIFT